LEGPFKLSFPSAEQEKENPKVKKAEENKKEKTNITKNMNN